ncbi:hypothetical protein B1H29_01220 [Streptomyces pactum]|uniref:Nudix hydrolase domain-containing protein n=1 Tax=Streptomyces pactum TaxID=68249 RepID=A0A1S6J1W4_9ACTN|nr:hypothetical protein B1H29_01220 [Streptomyces pactum]
MPGSHVDPGESSREAAARELAEETGVRAPADDPREIGTWDQPSREPRGRYSTDAYAVIVPVGIQTTAGDDARTARWWPLNGLPNHLAFDPTPTSSARPCPPEPSPRDPRASPGPSRPGEAHPSPTRRTSEWHVSPSAWSPATPTTAPAHTR